MAIDDGSWTRQDVSWGNKNGVVSGCFYLCDMKHESYSKSVFHTFTSVAYSEWALAIDESVADYSHHITSSNDRFWPRHLVKTASLFGNTDKMQTWTSCSGSCDKWNTAG